MSMNMQSLGDLVGFGGHRAIVGERKWSSGGWRKQNLASPCKDSHVSVSLQKNTVHLEADYYPNRIEKLKQGVRKALFDSQDLILIDTLQRLGISYHFEEEINQLLYQSYVTKYDDDGLFHTALRFRLLRQSGYNVTQDVFQKFMNKEGKLKEDIKKDLFGLLSLHEASYTGTRGEEMLSQAMMLSKQQLHKLQSVLKPTIARDLDFALEFPRQRRMERYEAKSYIEKYDNVHIKNPDLFELATLDFNAVQRQYQREIGELQSWWRDLGLAKKLSFARDRPLECFLWTVGMFPEPCFSICRVGVAKVVAILLVIDDIYDIQGSPEELDRFTDAIRRWNSDAIEELPEYMKVGYMAVYNTTNEIGFKILTEHGLYVVPHLRKTWLDLCEAFLLEAKWFRNETMPTLEDYINNGVTTAGTYMALVHAFFLMGKQITKESLDAVSSCPELFTSSGRILRLWDDLGTAKAEEERGDDASSINCYRNDNIGSSEDDARNHVKLLIDNAWQDVNRESVAKTPLPHSIIKASVNMARTAQAMYQHGDNRKSPSIDDCIQYLLNKPIHIFENTDN
nr:terpene synthase TPS14 [Freesia refracta]